MAWSTRFVGTFVARRLPPSGSGTFRPGDEAASLLGVPGLESRQNGLTDEGNVVDFEILPGVGAGVVRRRGSWADVVEAIPYLLHTGFPIPPPDILNQVLRTGGSYAGMSGGCRWPASELDDGAYRDLVADLLRRPEKHYFEADAPAWVQTPEDYRYWALEVGWGLPAEENRRYVQRLTALGESVAEARRRGDPDLADELRAEQTGLHREHGEWHKAHRRPSTRPDERP